MYALAAGAVGAGALASASQAEAKVVYTPANVNIAQNSAMFKLDLNHDGVPDFGLINQFRTFSMSNDARLLAKPLKSANDISGKPGHSSYPLVYALAKGDKIGPQAKFDVDYPLGGAMAVYGQYSAGYWQHTTAYLGLKFVIKGKIHYGWARVKVARRDPRGYNATLTGYAYETIANKAILAGATKGSEKIAGSPGMLAAGAAK